MGSRTQTPFQVALPVVSVFLLVAGAFVLASCGSSNTNVSVPLEQGATIPVSITDAPSDQVVAASLTLNSIVLTTSSGTAVNLLSAPLTFEAAHLDAVQEPLFTPAVPQNTYTSVSLTYSNAQVAYIDPTTNQLVLTTATLANTSQTITFPSPIAVNNSVTALLVDYLVAKSVTFSGSTVTVAPTFAVAPAPIAAQPTNGTNGLQAGVMGKVTALGTNQFTLTNVEGISLSVNVNTNTQYQGLSGFSALAVGALVEVDLETQTDGSLLALRVEERVAPNATAELLVGPVISVTGSPAASFTQVVRRKIGPPVTATPVEKDTITVDSSTKFQLPGRWTNLLPYGLPFTPTFDASTLFAGQVVAVDTNGVTNNAATALSVTLAPQTVEGTMTGGAMPTCVPCWGQITVTLASDSWLAKVTGQTTVTVYVSSSGILQMITPTAPAVTSVVRFNGFLVKNGGALALIALVEGPAPGTAIAPVP